MPGPNLEPIKAILKGCPTPLKFVLCISISFFTVFSIFSLVLIIPTIAVTCRRLHDVNKSGWWQLLWITIIGGILLIVWNATEGEKKKNRFGPSIKIKK